MIAILHDIVRAALVLAVLAVGCEIIAVHRDRPAPAPPQPTAWQPAAAAWQPQPQAAWQTVAPPAPQPDRPIRRVASSVVDLAESVLGVIR